jgi:hypothetical protein
MKKADKVIPYVFHRNGDRIVTFRSAWKRACVLGGCPASSFTTCAVPPCARSKRSGMPRSVAMSFVGHRTESIYRRYAIVDEAMQREAAARLDAWLKSTEPGQKSSTIATFPPKTAKVTKPRRQKSA